MSEKALPMPHLFTAPSTSNTSSGLGGGISWAWEADFCARLLPRFWSEKITYFGAELHSFADCEELKAVLMRSMTQWSSHRRRLSFYPVQDQCADATPFLCAPAEVVFKAAGGATAGRRLDDEEEVEVVAYADSWSAVNPYRPPSRRLLEASSGDAGSGDAGSGAFDMGSGDGDECDGAAQMETPLDEGGDASAVRLVTHLSAEPPQTMGPPKSAPRGVPALPPLELPPPVARAGATKKAWKPTAVGPPSGAPRGVAASPPAKTPAPEAPRRRPDESITTFCRLMRAL